MKKEVKDGGSDESSHVVLCETLKSRLAKFQKAQFVVEQFIEDNADLETIVDEADVFLGNIRKVRS